MFLWYYLYHKITVANFDSRKIHNTHRESQRDYINKHRPILENGDRIIIIIIISLFAIDLNS